MLEVHSFTVEVVRSTRPVLDTQSKLSRERKHGFQFRHPVMTVNIQGLCDINNSLMKNGGDDDVRNRFGGRGEWSLHGTKVGTWVVREEVIVRYTTNFRIQSSVVYRPVLGNCRRVEEGSSRRSLRRLASERIQRLK